MAYKIYTTEFDEVVRPLDLVDEEELLELAENFHKLCPVEDLEPLRERLEAFKVPNESTLVTLLVDNSGSMRGYPISFAIGAVGIISMYLDRLGVPNEILGFTTKAWKGGDAHEKWHSKGRPINPGRLNALRHIIYKQVDEKLQDVRHYLALMMREGILKENIDGEAVQWACERLRTHDAQRKILLVISDGSPIDASTMSANSHVKFSLSTTTPVESTLLVDHLREVISELHTAGDILLDAIGISHFKQSRYDVKKYYGVGDIIEKLEDLAPVALTKLEQLLTKEMPQPARIDLDGVMRAALKRSIKHIRTLPRPTPES